MASVLRSALQAALLIAALVTLIAAAALVHAGWQWIGADPASPASRVDRGYAVAFFCVVMGAAAALRIARRLRDLSHADRADEPALWI